MSSAQATERAPSLLLRGVACGACAGAVVGLLDGLRAWRAGNEVVDAHDVLPVVAWYVAAFAVCGLPAALIARRFAWPQRALGLLVRGGAALFFVGAWLNVALLDDFLSPFSIAVDLGLLVLAALWLRVRYRGPGTDALDLRRWFAAAALAVLVAAGLRFGVAARDDGPPPQAVGPEDGARPNVLVFLVDTLRADALGCYGRTAPTSPEIDAFAADATLFEDCRATTSWTKPSVASLFTSLYPTSHACVQQREVLVPELETLAETFRAAGWRTAAFSDNPFITPAFGFGQGFDHFDCLEPSRFVNGTLLGKALFMLRAMSLDGRPFGVGDHVDRGAERLVGEGLLPWIDERRDAPWFAYVQTMEPHLPYDPPRADAEAFGLPAGAPYRRPPAYNGILPFQTAPEPDPGLLRDLRAQYDGEVRSASRAFGRLLDALRERRQLENTIVVLLSDHGEEFHEHGGWTHGHSLHAEVLRVPLIVRVPDSVANAAAGRGRRVGGIASVLDVAPTLTDLARIRYPRGADAQMGTSLRACLVADEGARPQNSVLAHRTLVAEVSMGPVRLRSVRAGRWLLIRASAPPLRDAVELYDAVSDPRERRPLEGEDVTRVELETTLTKSFRALEQLAVRGQARTIDAETRVRLDELGYVGGR